MSMAHVSCKYLQIRITGGLKKQNIKTKYQKNKNIYVNF